MQESLKKTTEGYKIMADKRRWALEIQVGDLVWAVLTKDSSSLKSTTSFLLGKSDL